MFHAIDFDMEITSKGKCHMLGGHVDAPTHAYLLYNGLHTDVVDR